MKIKTIKEIIKEDQQERAVLTDDKLRENMEKADKKIVKKERKLRNFQRLVLYIFIIFFIIWLLFYFAIGLTSAPNNDMYPSFHGGDLVIYDKMNKNPGINDVVVFEKKGTTYLGRVIAKGGDKVEILETGGIRINDAALNENNAYGATIALTTVEYPLTLAEDEYFVLADAREQGEDSRFFGPVRKSEISGRAAGLFRKSGL